MVNEDSKQLTMNAATISIFIWEIYVLLMGLLLVLIPGKHSFFVVKKIQKIIGPELPEL